MFSVISSVINTEIIISPEHIITRFCKTKNLETSLVSIFNKPICFQYIGDIKEVCIYFEILESCTLVFQHLNGTCNGRK